MSSNHPNLVKGYERAKRYWLISLVPVAIFIVYTQIMQGHEMITDSEGFREKIDNSWFNQTFDQTIDYWFGDFFDSEN